MKNITIIFMTLFLLNNIAAAEDGHDHSKHENHDHSKHNDKHDDDHH